MRVNAARLTVITDADCIDKELILNLNYTVAFAHN